MRNKKGFTLMEVLIIVAMIAILIVMAIPSLTIAFEKVREAKDVGNIRSAMTELAEVAILNESDFAERGINFLRDTDTGDCYYQKIVYCTQKKENWQLGDKNGKMFINGAEIGSSSYDEVNGYWYVRYYVSGSNEGKFAVPVKSNTDLVS